MAHPLSVPAPRELAARWRWPVAAILAAAAMGQAIAQAVVGPSRAPEPAKSAEARFGPDAQRPERSINEWLLRMHDASRQNNYIGTFVVSSNTGAMSSARIWHACDGQQQLDRVDLLTGQPRTVFRRNDEVLTFIPESRVVRSERREVLGLFPDLARPQASAIAEFYTARQIGSERAAGLDADVVQVQPRDSLRFGYRIWTEKKTGLVMKVQTLDPEGNVLEQSAFSELQIGAPVRMDKLARMMAVPDGWRLEKPEAMKTTAGAEGWGLRAQVPGFTPVSCYKRQAEGVLQWIFTDGLASVSLFIEAYDRQRHVQEGVFATGATHTLARRMQDWWLTAVGEVPAQTLRAFAQHLERRR